MNNNCIMLIDDSRDDNFFNKRAILQHDPACTVIAMTSPVKALQYLRSNEQPKPDVIFLDIYMPVMDGWEFLDEYSALSEIQKDGTVVVMLATSGDPAFISKAKELDSVSDYIVKPLTQERMREIWDIHNGVGQKSS